MYVFAGTRDYLLSADKWLLCIYCIILAKTFTRAIFIEETNSLA